MPMKGRVKDIQPTERAEVERLEKLMDELRSKPQGEIVQNPAIKEES